MLEEFDALWARSLDNTGTRGGGGKKGTGSKGKKAKACLYDCNGASGLDVQASVAVARIAGSPAVYRSDRPQDVRVGISLVGAVKDQGSCASW